MAVARRFDVSLGWVRKLVSQRRRTGSIAIRPHSGRKAKLVEHQERLRELVAGRPDTTLHELRDQLPVRVSISTLSCVCAASASLSRIVLHATEQLRPDVAERRAKWRVEMLGLDPLRLVCIDETWVKTNMTRVRGRAPVGQRLVDYVPHGHWKTTTFIAVLRVRLLTAPVVFDGAVNGEIFRVYVKDHLAPTLRPGDILVMDNLSSHKVQGVAEAIEAAGARVAYLPPYSPDLNPIQRVFAKLKALLRKHGERTVEALWNRVGYLVLRFTSKECRTFLRHSG